MSEQSTSPVLIQVIPAIRANEGSPIQPFDFKEYIQNPLEVDGSIHFEAELKNGSPLPGDLKLSVEGVLTGSPPVGSASREPYVLLVIASNDQGEPLMVPVDLVILPAFNMDAVESAPNPETDADLFAEIGLSEADMNNLLEELATSGQAQSKEIVKEKLSIWLAIAHNSIVPEAKAILDRPISYKDVYHLLSRFAHFIIWNADDMSEPAIPKELQLEGMSNKFKAFDRGCCLVVAPVHLHDHDRTMTDALVSAGSLAKEAYVRGWNVEFAGFDKMVSYAWANLNILNERYENDVEIKHYQPNNHDYNVLAQIRGTLE